MQRNAAPRHRNSTGDRAGKGAGHAAGGDGARADVPGGAAGFADPLLATEADQVGQGFADGDKTAGSGSSATVRVLRIA